MNCLKQKSWYFLKGMKQIFKVITTLIPGWYSGHFWILKSNKETELQPVKLTLLEGLTFSIFSTLSSNEVVCLKTLINHLILFKKHQNSRTPDLASTEASVCLPVFYIFASLSEIWQTILSRPLRRKHFRLTTGNWIQCELHGYVKLVECKIHYFYRGFTVREKKNKGRLVLKQS